MHSASTRTKLESDVAKFLDAGGEIEVIDSVPATGGTMHGRRVCALIDCLTTFDPPSRAPWMRFCSNRCKTAHDQAMKRKPPVPKQCACGRWFFYDTRLGRRGASGAETTLTTTSAPLSARSRTR